MALRVDGSLGVHVKRRSAFVENGVEALPISVLEVIFEMQKEAAELQSLLLPHAQDIGPIESLLV